MKKTNWKRPEIKHGQPTCYGWTVLYPECLDLGTETDIGAFSLIVAKYGVKIGRGVQIGSHCALYSFSTIDRKKGAVVLEKNCSIGTHSTVMPGVTIGEGAVVAAHSFVKTDVPPHALYGGVPARPIFKAIPNSRDEIAAESESAIADQINSLVECGRL